MKSNKNVIEKEKRVVNTDENDCTTVMHAEMARNYEDNEPCNDGTNSKENIKKDQ